MPARFVEVTNPIHTARNADPLAYVHGVNWTNWAAGAFGGWTGAGNASNASSAGASFARAANVLSGVCAPEGAARWALCAAAVLWAIRWLLLRRAARHVVSQYGHAHAE